MNRSDQTYNCLRMVLDFINELTDVEKFDSAMVFGSIWTVAYALENTARKSLDKNGAQIEHLKCVAYDNAQTLNIEVKDL